jgi:hypothetical protein
MQQLAKTFADERSKLEPQLVQGEDISTEDLRMLCGATGRSSIASSRSERWPIGSRISADLAGQVKDRRIRQTLWLDRVRPWAWTRLSGPVCM